MLLSQSYSFLKSSVFIDRYKDNIAATIFNIKARISFVAKITIIHAAERLEKMAEKTFSCESVNSILNFIAFIVAK